MTSPDSFPLPDEAHLARLNDALDARVDGRQHRVPGTVEPDDGWLAAIAAARDMLRGEYPELGASASQRDAAIAAALAHAPAPHTAHESADDQVVAAAQSDHESVDRLVHVVRPAQWQRRLLTAAAAASLLVVAVAALARLGSNDADMSSTEMGGADMPTLAADASAEADGSTKIAASEVAGATTGSTIDAIVGPASAPLVIDSVDGLRELGATYAASVDAAPPGTSVGTQTASRSTMAVPGFDCQVGDTEIVLTEVVWQGTLGFAVYDSSTGVVRVVDASCSEVAAASP